MSQLDVNVCAAVEAAVAKQAEDLVVLDVSEVCNFADHLIICHGSSSRQVKTITDAVIEALRTLGCKPHHVEGESKGEWVLIDYMDFVMHVFQHDRRQFFALERLWGDAPQVDLSALTGGRPGTKAPGARA